jgi:signal transduction histidine kinase
MVPHPPTHVLWFFYNLDLLQPQMFDILLLAALVGLLGVLVGFYLNRWVDQKRLEQFRKQAGKQEADQVRRSERTRLNGIYSSILSLTASLNYQRVLESALDLSTSLLDSNGSSARLVASVLLFTEGKSGSKLLSVGSARRFTPTDMRLLLPAESGLLAQVIETGEPGFSNQVPGDPELARIVALHPCQAVFCVPLQSGLDTYGLLLFGHPEPEYFTPDCREILLIVGKQAVIAIQNARLYGDLEQEKERMMEIQEEARKKLARDLHDGPTQAVAAIAMRVNFARRLVERDLEAAVDELGKIEELARHTTKEIRHMLFTLRPLVLESQGLVPALQAMAEKMKETYNQCVTVEAEADIVPKLEMSKQAVVFYIVEEAVNNARKHAQAAQIEVRLKAFDTQVALLEIEDNGVGFNVGAVDAFYDKRGSLGMVNMRERAELVNGVMRIDSVEGKGTLVQVAIPLTEEAAERLRSRT